MRRHDEAENEQLRTLISPELGLDRSRATLSQITGFKQRPENIMIAMITKGEREHAYDVKRVHGPHRRATKRNKA